MNWIQVFIYIATLVISYALRPKQEPPERTQFEDLRVPNSKEGQSLKVVFGTVERRDPLVTWYDNLNLRAVKVSGSPK